MEETKQKRLRLGFLIKEARMYAKLQQDELAKKIGKSTRTVCNYENGHTVPPMAILVKLTDVLKESFESLGKTNMLLESANEDNTNDGKNESGSFYTLKYGFYPRVELSDKFSSSGSPIEFIFEKITTQPFKDCAIYEILNISSGTKELRRVQKLSGDNYKLFYDNVKYEPVTVQGAEIELVGIAVSKIEML